MRKKVFGRKLSRGRGSREALFKALVKAMIERGIVVTTKAKAKAVQPILEKLVSASKTKDIAVVRRVASFFANDKKALEVLFGKIAEVFKSRNGGFTKLTNLPRRVGDFAEMVRVEWSEAVILKEKVNNSKDKQVKAKKEVDKENKGMKKTLTSRLSKFVSKKND